jgi:hypothetical protein
MSIFKKADCAINQLNTEAMLADIQFTNKLDEAILQKFAGEMKRIAPKANDFLYFSAIMMHAAEASLLDSEGNLKKDASGKPLEAHWEPWENNKESLRWVCSDSSIRPLKNANGDSFPEQQLLKAYKNWAGKPLCMDHKSSSCDNVYGLIVDTYYDHKHKRIVALCALDKKTYPDLARKISTGVLNSVSMGTAVGKAICSDCGTIARVESEYCSHMKTKSCYCEINIDLNPLELSLVVNGADRDAKIRHIVASANNLASSLDITQKEVSNVKTGSITAFELSKLESEILNLSNKLDSLKKEASDSEIQNLQENDLSKISNFLNSIENRLEKMSENINKLSSFQENKENMANVLNKEAYMQGTEEPKPRGTPQYPVDPMNDKVKNTEDKQLLGASPFPGTGPVDGMHPGYQSFGESELARKERLKRASEEVQERQLRRKAAMDKIKEAYMQGTEEPKPRGTPQYPVDPKNDQVKTKEDKQLVGAPPFPGVGKIDGLYGDDLAKKEKLSRAKKTFKFVKAANGRDGSLNKDDSQWQIFADDKLILSASVKEISGGKSDLMYDHIASESFGKKISQTLKSEGYDKTVQMLKGAQMAPAAPTDMLNTPPAPAPTAPATDPMGAPPSAEMPDVMDKGEAGENQNNIPELITQMQNLLSDLAKATETMGNTKPSNDLQEFDQLATEMPKAASEKMKVALLLQRKLPKEISKEAKLCYKRLSKSIEELKYASIIYKDEKFQKTATKKDLKEVNSLTKESLNLAKIAIADSVTTLTSVIDYAKGNNILNKKIAGLKMLKKQAQEKMKEEKPKKDENDANVGSVDGDLGLTPYEKELQDKLKNMKVPASTQEVKPQETKQVPQPLDSQNAIDFESKMPDGSTVKGKADSLKDLKASKEERAQLRLKLGEKVTQMSNWIDLAHPKGGPTVELNPKPTGDLAKVETISEAHKKIEDLATSTVKVKKAEEIHKLVSEGKLDESDVDMLVSQGVDPEAVKYYKQYFAQAKDGGSQFAAEMLKEKSKQKQAETQEALLAKTARAWELTEEMVEKGALPDTKADRKRQASEIINWSDETFNNVVATLNKLPILKKQASINYNEGFPNIGSLVDAGFGIGSTTVPDYKTSLEQAFATIKPGARSGR